MVALQERELTVLVVILHRFNFAMDQINVESVSFLKYSDIPNTASKIEDITILIESHMGYS
jgi:hypothetical protein